MMKIKSIMITVVILTSCSNQKECASWGDNNLGGEFTLLEGDRIEDRAFVYCTGRDITNNCCYAGASIIPSFDESDLEYVIDAKSTKKWISLKTKIRSDNTHRWYILNKSELNISDDCKSSACQEMIKSKIIGPLDSLGFISKANELSLPEKLVF